MLLSYLKLHGFKRRPLKVCSMFLYDSVMDHLMGLARCTMDVILSSPGLVSPNFSPSSSVIPRLFLSELIFN